MNIRHAMLLIASCILVFTRIALASDVLSCKLPQHFTMKLSNDRFLHLSEAELNVRLYYDKISLVSYKGTNTISVQSNFVGVSFNGFVSTGTGDAKESIQSQPEVLHLKYVDRISGIAQRVSNSSELDSCRMVLLPTEVNRPEATGRIANEIRRLAESCIEPEICAKIGAMKNQYMIDSPVDVASDLLFSCPDPIVIVNEGCEEIYNTDSVQPIFNKAVDVGVERVTEMLRNMNGGILGIPDIVKEFSTGSGIFTTTGHFKAINGTFRDLTTIRRISDISLSHNGPTVTAACEFGLDIADLEYPYYSVKYGVLGVDGKISGTVNNTKIVAQVAADYNSKPCRLTMNYIRVTELGDLNIDITGLGPMNWMVTKLLSWITSNWRENITVALQRQLMLLARDQLAAYDCEQYRP